MIKILKKISNLFSLFGFNLKNFISLIYLPKFIKDLLKFSIISKKIHGINPILTDFKDKAGNTKGHYFHQDLLVSQFIYNDNPDKHLDIASRIDGFVAHVASYRKIDVSDIRKIENTIENINFKQHDFMGEIFSKNKYPSVSCLHAIEHFGLGRYGDKIDINGHLKGFSNIIKILDIGGKLYISFPISDKPRIEFNAHRVFHPNDIFRWDGCEKLELVRFDYVNDGGMLVKNSNPNDIKNIRYGCGIYTFLRKI